MQENKSQSIQNASTTKDKDRLGIIGGGQLGMYLCEAARELNVHTTVLMTGATQSAAFAADACIVASLGDTSAVKQLIDLSDVITFELEAVPQETLQLLQDAVEKGELRVNPGVATLRLLQNKGLQKSWLKDQSIPTLPFVRAESRATFFSKLSSVLEFPLVQKSCQGGYDGKGVQMIPTEDDLHMAWPVDSIFEPMLQNRVEVSVIVVRAADGSLASYPPVSMEFDERFNAVSLVTSPAAVSLDIQQSCQALARHAIEKLDGIGVFAVEFFVAADDTVFVNEISPRVHNSGHLTMEAFSTSQFEQHVRAIMGYPLAPIEKQRESAVMRNILYDQTWSEICPSEACRIPVKSSLMSQVHWYGKPPGHVGRKMGHITTLGNSSTAAYAESRKALASLKPVLVEESASSSIIEE